MTTDLPDRDSDSDSDPLQIAHDQATADMESIPLDPDLVKSLHNKLKRVKLTDAVRLTPATFAHYITGGRWIPAKHLLYTAGKVTVAIRRGNAFLLIAMPPRHGKSELLSVHTPEWRLDDAPDKWVMLTTYGAELATGFGRRVRDTILTLTNNQDADDAFLRCTLKKDALQVDSFQTTKGGGMYSVGIGGPITGRGAHLLAVDDYVKNAKDAESETVQNQTYDWFVSTAMTRLEPQASVVVFATRWNLYDLGGKLLDSEFKNDIEHIRLPALAEDDDPLGRKPGDALWPERYSKERLLFLQKILGKYFFSALYQQRPIKRTDLDIDENSLLIEPNLPHPSQLKLVRGWDLAASKNRGDYTVGSLLGRKLAPIRSLSDTFILDQVRVRETPTKVEQLMLETALLDGPQVPIAIEQEPGASGKAYAEYLRDTLLKGFRVDISVAQTDKFLKAQPVLAAIESRHFRTAPGPWVSSSRSELKDFPAGAHDDIIDSWAIGFNFLNRDTLVHSPTWGRTPSGLVVPTEQLPPQAYSQRPMVVFGRR